VQQFDRLLWKSSWGFWCNLHTLPKALFGSRWQTPGRSAAAASVFGSIANLQSVFIIGSVRFELEMTFAILNPPFDSIVFSRSQNETVSMEIFDRRRADDGIWTRTSSSCKVLPLM
jgi:hypothetical protein